MPDTTPTRATAGDSGAGLDAQLDQILSAARGGGITSLDPAAAVGIVDRVRGSLAGADDPALVGIATELESFRTVLASGNTGPELREALTTLAGKVTALADQGGPASDRLRELGRALAQGGGRAD